MNLVINGGLTLLSWAIPQLAAPVRAYRYGRTAYKVAQLGLNIFRGSFWGTATSLWSFFSSTRDCDLELQMCIDHIDNGMMGDGGTGIAEISCWALYRQCVNSQS